MLLDPRPQLLRPVRVRTGVAVPVVACLVLAALSVAFLPSTPSYDPWAWIVWGREITQGDLDTLFGPSWKPLPVLFTTPLALTGDLAPDLWLVLAQAATLGAAVMAYRLGTRFAGPLAGVLGALVLLLQPSYLRTQLLGFSEGLLVLCGLLAVERHLDGHRTHAFALGLAAGLLRPEAWPFVGLYALYLLWEERASAGPASGSGHRGRSRWSTAALVTRSRFWWLATGGVAMVALWVLPELWGSGNLFRAAERANSPNPGSPAFAPVPSLAVLGDFAAALGPVAIAGLVLAPLAARSRAADGEGRRGVTLLAALAAGWLGLVAVMTELGFAGNLRYLFLPMGFAAVVAGAGIAWAAGWLATRRDTARGRRIVALGAAALAAAGLGVTAALELPDEAELVAYEAQLREELPVALGQAGGPRALLDCGEVAVNPFMVPWAAWELEVHTRRMLLETGGPGTVIRARYRPGADPMPAPGVLAGAPVLGRTELWEVTGTCGR
ncbi:MAG: hypothetical protein MSC31_18910 [Solirubrobacteraceae bacterium MAG38_C4-C5]|nr:hypothetical protein [Candidatus Siliceabacter maunaloa]